jgi:small subunit ribosomal protein S1
MPQSLDSSAYSAAKAEAEARTEGGDVPASYSSEAPEAEGTLASDEALAALREKLTGGF